VHESLSRTSRVARVPLYLRHERGEGRASVVEAKTNFWSFLTLTVPPSPHHQHHRPELCKLHAIILAISRSNCTLPPHCHFDDRSGITTPLCLLFIAATAPRHGSAGCLNPGRLFRSALLLLFRALAVHSFVVGAGDWIAVCLQTRPFAVFPSPLSIKAIEPRRRIERES